jgi:membrane protease YdiL (CAAX protease family)
MQNVTAMAAAALAVELIPAIAFGFATERIARSVSSWPAALRVSFPALFVLPYLMVSLSARIFQWSWFALYVLLPVAIAGLLVRAARVDAEQRGNWRDAFVLLVVGLAVDVGLYGFLAIRQLRGTGFNFCLKWSDWKTGLRELVFFAPVVIACGMALGFIHPHWNLPGISSAVLRWVLIFFFTAVPEELFFRGWVQNLLERRLGRRAALVIASILFGLSHFNKRSIHFNWRYVLLATIAGIFYGRAWRENRRVAASTITHASVDWLWGLWF